VYWYQSPSALKLMIDRLVCADGGNPDPTTTSGKNAEMAKDLELAGWAYPKHLAGRTYGSSYMATLPESKARAGRFPTGSTGWA
jgi:multimeric flavodoxin WrbA